jgi:hypothetical protein
MPLRAFLVAVTMVLAVAGVASAQQVNPADVVARGKLDLARLLMQQSRWREAQDSLIEVIQMPGVSGAVRGQSFLMAGNLALRTQDYGTARIAYTKLLDLPGASEEDRKAARFGLDLVESFERVRQR